MRKIECIKEYPMVGSNVKEGTILTEIPSKEGQTSYKDEQGNIFNFDNSEILFSLDFQTSFTNCGTIKNVEPL